MTRKLMVPALFLAVIGLILGTTFNQSARATVPGANTLVSVNNTGNGQGGNSHSPTDLNGHTHSISANGRYVVFTSYANDLVSGDTNGKSDVFVRDLVNGTTTRVNVSTSGAQANDGITWSSGDKVAISSTGRYIVFPSLATNLIDGQTTSTPQIYMRDMVTNTTTIISQTGSGTLANSAGGADVNSVSNDGRFVVWKAGLNTTLVSTETNTSSDYVYLTDRKDQTTQVLNHTPATGQYFVNGVSASCDGSLVAFGTSLQLDPSDTDSSSDVYIVDTRNGLETTVINAVSTSSTPSLSCNGEYVLLSGGHKYLYDRINDTLSMVDTSTSGVVGNNSSDGYGGVDDKGNTVFMSTASNLIAGTTIQYAQVYLKHKDTGVTEILSKPNGGSRSNGTMLGSVSISADGKTAVYPAPSTVTNLLSSDTNGMQDVIASSTGL